MLRKTCLVLIVLLIIPCISSAEIKTFTHTVKQPFAGSQSPDDARVTAIHKAKREVLEKAGTYLECMTIVRDYVVGKDETIALAAGILKAEIVGEPKAYVDGNMFGITVLAQVVVDTSILENRINKFLKDRTLLEKYKQSQDREKELLAKIEELQKLNERLSKGSSAEKEGLRQKFSQTINELTAVAWYNKALGLRSYTTFTKNVTEKALDYLSKAVRLDPDYGSAYNMIGWVYDDKGDYDRAIDYYEKALNIGLKKLGPEHPKVATYYNDLGLAYNYKGDYDRAIDYYEKALKIGIKRLGPNHPYTKIYRKNLDSVK